MLLLLLVLVQSPIVMYLSGYKRLGYAGEAGVQHIDRLVHHLGSLPIAVVVVPNSARR